MEGTLKRGQNPCSRPTEVKWSPSACQQKQPVLTKGVRLNADFICQRVPGHLSPPAIILLSEHTPGSGCPFLKTSPNSTSSVSPFRFLKGVLAQHDFHLMLYQLCLLSFFSSGNSHGSLFQLYQLWCSSPSSTFWGKNSTQTQPVLPQNIGILLGQRRSTSGVVCLVRNTNENSVFCFYNSLVLLSSCQCGFQ